MPTMNGKKEYPFFVLVFCYKSLLTHHLGTSSNRHSTLVAVAGNGLVDSSVPSRGHFGPCKGGCVQEVVDEDGTKSSGERTQPVYMVVVPFIFDCKTQRKTCKYD